MESEKEEIKIKRVQRGRPRTVNITDMKQYGKEYYEANKDKFKGDMLCPHCNLICSKSNKSRHLKKYHPEFAKKSITKEMKEKSIEIIKEHKSKKILPNEILHIFKKDIVSESILDEMIKIKNMLFNSKKERDDFVEILIKSKEHLPDDIESSVEFINLSDLQKSYHQYWYGIIPCPHVNS